MRFPVDRCAGRRLAEWLRGRGHDASEIRDRGPDPGDTRVLEWGSTEGRIVGAIDKDFGDLLFVGGMRHAGLIRLPDVPSARRIALMDEVLRHYAKVLDEGAIVTVRGGRVRITRTG